MMMWDKNNLIHRHNDFYTFVKHIKRSNRARYLRILSREVGGRPGRLAERDWKRLERERDKRDVCNLMSSASSCSCLASFS